MIRAVKKGIKGISSPKIKRLRNKNFKFQKLIYLKNRFQNFKAIKFLGSFKFLKNSQVWLFDKLIFLFENLVLYGMQSGYAIDGTVPVFAFPPAVNFYLNDVKTHKQIITIYNPYNATVKFKVLCTAPDKYQVGHAQGFVKSCCSTDLVVRHIALKVGNCNITDKIRIKVFDDKSEKPIGKKDITVTLHNGVPEPKENDNDSVTSADRVTNDWDTSSHNDHFPRDPHYRTSSNPIILLIGFISFLALFLPIEGDQSVIPLKITFNLKLVFSYILGLVTMVIFRS